MSHNSLLRVTVPALFAGLFTVMSAGLFGNPAGLQAADAAPAAEWQDISGAFTQQLGADGSGQVFTRRCVGMAVVPSGEIFMLTSAKGICVSADQGATWTVAENNHATGRCETDFDMSVAYPYDGRLAFFAIDGTGGITLDGGRSWRPFARIRRNFEFADLDWQRPEPQTVFGLTHEPYFRALSADGGRTWKQLTETQTQQDCLGVVDAATLVRASYNVPGISLSSDGGQSWAEVAAYRVLGRRPTHYGKQVYWTTTEGVIVSSNGKDWTLTGKGPEGADFGPYFGASDQEFMVVSRTAFSLTRDGGKTWKEVARSFAPPEMFRGPRVNQAGHFNYFGWDPKRDLLYASGIGGSIYKLQVQ